jgi:hypothetical protein
MYLLSRCMKQFGERYCAENRFLSSGYTDMVRPTYILEIMDVPVFTYLNDTLSHPAALRFTFIHPIQSPRWQVGTLRAAGDL